MPIVLEGPDGGGKTTLLNLLSRRYKGWEARHSGGPIKSDKDLKARKKEFMAKHEVVWDRLFYISEYVYGPLFGRELDPEISAINPPQALYIWCMPPDNELPPQDNPQFDTPEYVEKLKATRQQVVSKYQSLAVRFTQERPGYSHIYRWWNLTRILWACDRYVYKSIPKIMPNVVVPESFTREFDSNTIDPRDPVQILRQLAQDHDDSLNSEQILALHWALNFIRRNW